jgi:hypothetical protein
MTLRAVCPSFPANSEIDSCEIVPVFVRKLAKRYPSLSVSRSNGSHFVLSHLRHAVRFPARLPTLFAFVSHIEIMIRRGQMIWPHASRVVALVADEQPIWNCTISKFVRHPVRSVALSIEADLAIALGIDIAIPQPAFFSLLDQSPKLLPEMFALVLSMAIRRTIESVASRNYVRPRIKSRFAPDTNPVRFSGILSGIFLFSHAVHSFVVNELVRLVRVFSAPVRAVCILPLFTHTQEAPCCN